MGLEELDEPLQVGAVFKDGRVLPRWFLWGGVRRDVSAVNLVWTDREGERTLRRFSVSAGGNLYQLRLDQKSMEWRLEKAQTE